MSTSGTNRFLAWLREAGLSAIKVIAQTAVAMLGTTVLVCEMEWKSVLSASLMAGLISLLTSVSKLGTPRSGSSAKPTAPSKEGADTPTADAFQSDLQEAPVPAPPSDTPPEPTD